MYAIDGAYGLRYYTVHVYLLSIMAMEFSFTAHLLLRGYQT